MIGTSKKSIHLWLSLIFLLIFGIPVSISQETIPAYFPAISGDRFAAVYGVASWYSESDPYINLHTANGEIFDDSKITCASWHYPFGTRLKVTNLGNNQSVICRVNDRGPAKRLNRVVDLTKGAFRQIANLRLGLIDVQVVPLKTDSIFSDTSR